MIKFLHGLELDMAGRCIARLLSEALVVGLLFLIVSWVSYVDQLLSFRKQWCLFSGLENLR